MGNILANITKDNTRFTVFENEQVLTADQLNDQAIGPNEGVGPLPAQRCRPLGWPNVIENGSWVMAR